MSKLFHGLNACALAALIVPAIVSAAADDKRAKSLDRAVVEAEARGVAVAAPTVVYVPVAAPAPAALIVGGPATSLTVGTEVPLRLLTELTTKGKLLKVGDRFNLEVADPISVAGQVVIPVGSRAVGEITHVRNKGMWGKSGGIDARIMYVTANGKNIRASGSMNDKGTTGTAGVVGAVVFIPIAGFFMTGTSALIPAGTIVRAFIDEDVPIAFAAGSGPSPMIVSPAASVVVPATPLPAAPAAVTPIATSPR